MFLRIQLNVYITKDAFTLQMSNKNCQTVAMVVKDFIATNGSK